MDIDVGIDYPGAVANGLDQLLTQTVFQGDIADRLGLELDLPCFCPWQFGQLLGDAGRDSLGHAGVLGIEPVPQLAPFGVAAHSSPSFLSSSR